MAYKFNITPDGKNVISFDELRQPESSGIFRLAVNISVQSRSYGIDEYAIPGVDGMYLTRHGFRGRNITLNLMYSGPDLGAVDNAIDDDGNSISNTIANIDVTPGISYPRCQLSADGLTPDDAKTITANNGDILACRSVTARFKQIGLE